MSNTFGERHCYLLTVPADWQPGEALHQSCDKAFYVSPFIPIEGRYRFRVLPPGERLSLGIRLVMPEGDQLVAVQNGTRSPLSDRALLKLFFSYPLMTAKVMAGIHWEALKLWRKGATYFRRPAPPEEVVSLESKLPEAAE